VEAVNAEVNSGKGFANIGDKGFFRVLAKRNKDDERKERITLVKITFLLSFTLAAFNWRYARSFLASRRLNNEFPGGTRRRRPRREGTWRDLLPEQSMFPSSPP
jgi:hypothetical protein